MTPAEKTQKPETDGTEAIPLTAKQREVLEYIENCALRGYVPARTEIARACQRTPQTIDFHVKALAKKGFVDVSHTGGRIRLLKNTQPPLKGVPLQRCAPANLFNASRALHPGELTHAFDPAPDLLLAIENETFCVLGARLGDWLAVRTTEQANQGDLVVMFESKRWTCRRLRENDDLTHVGGVVIGALTARLA